MRLFVVLAICNACATVHIKQSARFDPGTVEQIYDLAQESFTKHLPCSLPRDVELIIKDATLVELNRGHNIFGADGLYIRQGLYEPAINTISLAAERPDRRFVLFHELLHFFITESIDCGKFRDVKEQHKYIAVMENDYFAATNRTREQEEDYHWILESVKKLMKD